MTQKRKLHIVHTESSGGWGGQEIRILTESQALIKNGHQITLLCDIDSPIANRAKALGITTVELPMGKKNVKGLLAIRHWLANNRADIVNTHSSSDSWMVAIAMRLIKKRVPLVRTRHVSAPVSNNRTTQWLYQSASDYIVTTGEKLKQTLISDNGIDPDKITSIPTGIDMDLFFPADDKKSIRHSLDLPSDKLIIGIVATLRSWKGHRYLIDAFKSMEDPSLHLLIVGHGPQWDNINQQIAENSLADQVTLCGDQKNVVPWLQAMDIFSLPSYANEGVPQSIMQAMACGLPTVSTNAGSIEEIVTEDTGIMVKKQDTEALAIGLKTLVDDTPLRNTLGAQARKTSIENCDIVSMAKKMEAVFYQCLEKPIA